MNQYALTHSVRSKIDNRGENKGEAERLFEIAVLTATDRFRNGEAPGADEIVNLVSLRSFPENDKNVMISKIPKKGICVLLNVAKKLVKVVLEDGANIFKAKRQKAC